jgi:hypothetical protein
MNIKLPKAPFGAFFYIYCSFEKEFKNRLIKKVNIDV